MESRLPTVDLEKLEWIAIRQALAENNDNRTHAAEALGISVRTLQRRLLRKTQPTIPAQSSGDWTTCNFVTM